MGKYLLFIFCFTWECFGAYRVYQLRLTRYDAKGRVKSVDKVLSTLDHLQYSAYGSEYGQAKVDLIDTWYCPGDTGGQKYCPKPKERNLQRGPAGLFSGKRTTIPVNRQPVIP